MDGLPPEDGPRHLGEGPPRGFVGADPPGTIGPAAGIQGAGIQGGDSQGSGLQSSGLEGSSLQGSSLHDVGLTGFGYSGPRISVPTFPPPPPEPEPKRRRGRIVTALVLAVLVVIGAATAISYSGSFGHDAASNTPGAGRHGSGQSKSPRTSVSNNPPDVAAISAALDPAVVDITAILALGSGEAAGTGMVITPTGEVLTNNHVIDEATSITAQIEGRGTKYTATVIGTDPSSDVALLQLKGASGLKTVSFGDSSSVSVGEPVVAIGNAVDLPGLPTVTSGKITGLDKPIIAQDAGTALCESLNGMLQTNAKLEPGNSGGPLVTSSGQVIGMNTAAASSGQSPGVGSTGSKIGFAIPIARAVQIITAMRNDEPSKTIHIGSSPLLGVQVIGVNGAGNGSACNKSHSSSGSGGFGLGGTAPVTSGALVVNVENGAPAAAAGIQDGDAITSFDNQPVNTPEDLTNLVQAMKPGDHVEVGWVDISGASHRATVTLATGPAD